MFDLNDVRVMAELSNGKLEPGGQSAPASRQKKSAKKMADRLERKKL